MSSPPLLLTNSAMNTIEGCASIANAAGNLLFYTDGVTVYDQTHTAMANGTGLLGNNSPCQSAIIIKKPGSATLYYIFTVQGISGAAGLNYSIVDMSLSSGNGSVTVKNAGLYNSGCAEKITATKHCNGIDFWIVTHDFNSTNIRAHLLTSVGMVTTAVLSSIGPSVGPPYSLGCLKFSPNGRKLGMTDYYGYVDLFDFDNNTGTASNWISLLTGYPSYGCEFSPDGSKFYAGSFGSTTMRQWNLCAGSNTAIVASQYTIVAGNPWSMQLASNGKIYVARNGSDLGIIHNPNGLGAACSYSNTGQSIFPRGTVRSIPNMVNSGFKPIPPPFTFTVSNAYGCQSAAFIAPFTVQTYTLTNCIASGYSLTGMVWNFGDPLSGTANTSTLSTPVHAFTNLGTYTTSLILYYSCGGGTDTIFLPVNINQACISVSSTSITCANLGSATVAATGGIGPFSYTWTPSAQTSSVATGLSPGTYTLTVFDFGNNFTYTATTVFTSLIPLTGNLNNSAALSCFGASNGTANVTNLAGGSGSQTYLWFNTVNSYTNPTVTTLSAGLWSVTVTDALTGCQIKQNFYITQPPAQNLILSAASPSACAGTSVVVSGTNSGGTPYLTGAGYTFSWTSGPASYSTTVTEALAGTYIYTLSSSDSLQCLISNTIALDFIPNPVLSVPGVSICPQAIGSLTAFGASSYTWTSPSLSLTGASFTASPLVNTQYTVVGSALACTTAAYPIISLKAVPGVTFSSNSPICNGQNLQLNAAGGVAYSWSGPLVYSSSLSNPLLIAASPANSGVYQFTATAANSCTNTASGTVTIHPTPTLSATGSTVCSTQAISLTVNSLAGSGFVWTCPLSFTSLQQTPLIYNPLVQASGNYTVKVTSALGCTNSAIAGVTVTAMPSASISSNSPRCFGETLNLNGSGGLLYSWAGPNSFSSLLQSPVLPNVTVPAAGMYTLTITTGPCVTSATRSITVYPLPVPTASNNGPLCETKKLLLSAGNSGNLYVWQGPLGYTNFNQHPAPIDSVKLNRSGIYSLTVTDAHNCSNQTTTTVTVLPNPVVTAVGATVCLNDSAVIKASGAITYVWYGPGNYNSNKANALIPKASNVSAVIYTVVGTAANSCTHTASVQVATIPLPIPALSTYPKNRLCLLETIQLEGFGGLYYDWVSVRNVHYTGKKISFLLSSLDQAGEYTLTVTDQNACKALTVTTISIDDLPYENLEMSSTQNCIPFKSFFKSTSSGNSANVKSNWNINDQVFSTKTFSYNFTRPGDYTMIGNFLDTTTNCRNTATFVVNAYALPVADFTYTPEKPVENMDEVVFTNTSKAENQSSWNWFFMDNSGYRSNKENTRVLFKDEGTYPVVMVLKDGHGCSDTIVKAVKVEADFNVYVPNAFTPNGDELNDVFRPVLRGIKFYELMVFDRWGQVIFETTELEKGWDGTYKGESCKQDVYVWKMNLSSNSGIAKVLNGQVSLTR